MEEDDSLPVLRAGVTSRQRDADTLGPQLSPRGGRAPANAAAGHPGTSLHGPDQTPFGLTSHRGHGDEGC